MTIYLKQIGDGFGLILDQQTLDRYGINERTPIVVTMTNDGILLRPARFISDEQLEAITDRIMATHAETLHKLAQ